MTLGRREFIGGAAMAAATAAKLAGAAAEPRRFSLNYAPHFGMFRHSAGDDLIDQLQFMADQGFTALEDNGMGGRSDEVQERIVHANCQKRRQLLVLQPSLARTHEMLDGLLEVSVLGESRRLDGPEAA